MLTPDQLNRLTNCLIDYRRECEEASFKLSVVAQDIYFVLEELRDITHGNDEDMSLDTAIDEASE